MSDTLTLNECVDRTQPKWTRWGAMVREHPNFLSAILALVPESMSEDDSIFRLVAIYQWLKDLGVELCELHVTETPCSHRKYLDDGGLVAYILFGDSPYNTHQGVPQIGRTYRDPDFPYLEEIQYRNIFILNLRDNRELSKEPIQYWRHLIEKAERNYFQNDALAPVCAFEWSMGRGFDDMQTEVLIWPANDAVFNMSAVNRRIISGYRPSGSLPDFAIDGAPDGVVDWKHGFQFDLTIYMPSELLMTQRNANKLQESTQAVGNAILSNRRVL